jgi:hypothetical protein
LLQRVGSGNCRHVEVRNAPGGNGSYQSTGGERRRHALVTALRALRVARDVEMHSTMESMTFPARDLDVYRRGERLRRLTLVIALCVAALAAFVML